MPCTEWWNLGGQGGLFYRAKGEERECNGVEREMRLEDEVQGDERRKKGRGEYSLWFREGRQRGGEGVQGRKSGGEAGREKGSIGGRTGGLRGPTVAAPRTGLWARISNDPSPSLKPSICPVKTSPTFKS